MDESLRFRQRKLLQKVSIKKNQKKKINIIKSKIKTYTLDEGVPTQKMVLKFHDSRWQIRTKNDYSSIRLLFDNNNIDICFFLYYVQLHYVFMSWYIDIYDSIFKHIYKHMYLYHVGICMFTFHCVKFLRCNIDLIGVMHSSED